MNTEMKPENDQNAPAPAPVLPAEVSQIMQVVKDYIVPVGAGILIALVIIIGFGLYKSSKAAKAEKAAAALMQAQSLEDIQRVAKEYDGTPAAPAALLGLANSYLQSGQILMAKNTYDQFISEYPSHIMMPSAELGKAYCLEAEGDLPGALGAYQAFVTKYPDYFLVPEAIFSQGRCLEQLGRFDESIVVYENFMVNDPESRWVPHAKTAILYVKKSKRAREKGIETPVQPLFSAPQQPVGMGTLPVVEAEVIEAPAADSAAPVVVEEAVVEVTEPVPEPVAPAPEQAPEAQPAPAE